ncbi:MAG: hypothetical protein N3F63_01440 [Thermoplasmata archaeon]|nr:hypothetical protein [Thermoplasmata archaeon]
MEYAEIKSIMKLGALAMSVLLTLLIGLNIRARKVHIYAWTAAWAMISLRTFVSLSEPLPLAIAFLRDLLIVLADVLFYVGIAHLLEMDTHYKYIIPLFFLFLHLGVSGILYLFFESSLYGATFTNLFSNPVLLFIVFYFFNEGSVRTGNLGLRVIGLGFLLWGIDFAIFGPLYYGAGYVFAGMCGWTIGFIARLIILLGFVLILPKRTLGKITAS